VCVCVCVRTCIYRSDIDINLRVLKCEYLYQLSHDGVYNIDEERENIPPEILEEGHRIINTCNGTRKFPKEIWTRDSNSLHIISN
jgi:hypothetical protein